MQQKALTAATQWYFILFYLVISAAPNILALEQSVSGRAFHWLTLPAPHPLVSKPSDVFIIRKLQFHWQYSPEKRRAIPHKHSLIWKLTMRTSSFSPRMAS
jgi:hypothetical protein